MEGREGMGEVKLVDCGGSSGGARSTDAGSIDGMQMISPTFEISSASITIGMTVSSAVGEGEDEGDEDEDDDCGKLKAGEESFSGSDIAFFKPPFR